VKIRRFRRQAARDTNLEDSAGVVDDPSDGADVQPKACAQRRHLLLRVLGDGFDVEAGERLPVCDQEPRRKIRTNVSTNTDPIYYSIV
jgi:hypothetical protein